MSNTEQMVSELLPCPFCKASMRIESNQDWHRVMGEHDEECVFLDPETMMVPATDEQRELLVRDWNRRARLAAQHQGEPVFSLAEPVAPWFYFADCADPDYSRLFNHESEAQTQVADHGGEVVRLWNVPPHADAGEVERLHNGHVKSLEALNQQSEKQRDHWIDECKALRAQLAERDALLRDINKRHSSGVDFDLPADLAARVAALSASAEPSAREAQALKDESRLGIERLPAEPSAPVELDEQAEFMAWANKEYEVAPDEELNLKNPSVRDNKIGWLARAALERKP